MPVDPLIDPPLETPAEPPAKTRYGMHWSAVAVCALLALAHLAVFVLSMILTRSDSATAMSRLGAAIGGMTVAFLVAMLLSYIAFYIASRSRRLATIVFIFVITMYGLNSLVDLAFPGRASRRTAEVQQARANFYNGSKMLTTEYLAIAEQFKAAGPIDFSKLHTVADIDAMVETLQRVEKNDKKRLSYITDGEKRLVGDLMAAGATRDELESARSEFRSVYLANGDRIRTEIAEEIELIAGYRMLLSDLRSIDGKWKWDAEQGAILYDEGVPDELITRHNKFWEGLAARHAKQVQAAPGAEGPPGK